MKRLLLLLTICISSVSFGQNCSDLFISEYVEGYDNNKAIEIYNPTCYAIDLSEYMIIRYWNGVTSVNSQYAIQLHDTISPKQTYVAVLDKRDPNGVGWEFPVGDSLQSKADGFYCPDYSVNRTFYFDGNDGIALAKGTTNDINNSVLVDIFGKIGEDPGLAWTSEFPYTGAGLVVTRDHSMIRKTSVLKGVTNSVLSFFNPLLEYDSIPPVIYDQNTNTYIGNWASLGSHSCDCDSLTGSLSVSLLELINTCGNNGSIDIEAIGGSGAYSYEWTNNTGTIIGTNSAIANLDAGDYSLTLSDNTLDCTGMANYTIEDVSIASDGATSFNSACAELADGQIYFSIEYNDLQTYTPYIIELSNGSIDTLYSNNGYAFSLEAGTYTYSITDENGCTYLGSNPIEIAANDMNFGIDLQPNPSAGQSPLLVIFDNNTPNASNYNFTWYFGDGTSEQNNSGFVSHTYAVDGLWDVVIVAEEIATGCTDTLTLDDYIFSTGGVSCTHSATINQSGPITGCAGSILLTCNTDPLFTYQWNINGLPINGATDSEYAPLTNGNYSVTIYQDNCPVNSGSVSVSITNVVAPLISGSGTITSCAGGSITLDAGSGYSDYLWSTGGTGQTEVVTSSGDYTVTVTDATTGCSVTSAPYTVNASFMQPQQLCIVGMDSLSNFNRVVWEKPISDGIDYFNVYKEGSAANEYDLIGSVPYDDTAVFVDVNSNAAVKAYRYKVSIIDTCGTETSLGEFHKTIHLTINQGVGETWNLIWNHYEGFGFPSYNIYRGTDPSNISLFTTIASNLNSYTDLNPPGGSSIYYQIEVVNTSGCDPLKATDYGVSRSNIATVGEGNILELTIEEISISPNPTTNLITIQSETELNNKFKIYDQQGREVMNGKLTGKNTEVSLGKLSRGTYTIQVDGNYKPAVIIKQ